MKRNKITDPNIIDKKAKRRKIERICKITVLILLLVYFITGINNKPIAVFYTLESDKIDGNVRLCVISDLHSSYYGEGESGITDIVDEYCPDIVLFTGDIFDEDLYQDHAWTLTDKLVDKYDCFFITGNHEEWSGEADEIMSKMEKKGVIVLSDSLETVNVNGNDIEICGVRDPAYITEERFSKNLHTLSDASSKDKYSILLCHRPNYASEFKKLSFDLILSGHMHGGQWRVPGIINGLYAPGHFLFPKYCGGLYTLNDDTKMIVSRGLALDNVKIPRVHNRPEIVFIDLK